MHVAIQSLLLSALISLTTSSALPLRALALRNPPSSDANHNALDFQVAHPQPPKPLRARMDVIDPGEHLFGRNSGWTMTLARFYPIVGAIARAIPQAHTELENLYAHSLSTLQNYAPGTVLNVQRLFFQGGLLSFMVRRVSGTEGMSVEMLEAFCSHMMLRLAMGGYRGVYVVYLRQKVGPGMFQVMLQSNPSWVSQGIGGLPGMVGLAAMGF